MNDPDRTLSHIKLFRGLPAQVITQIEDKCHWQTHRAGEEIIGQFDASRTVFFIVHGLVSVLVFSMDGRQVDFRELGPGQQFGEFSALDGAPRSASVTAGSDCQLACLSHTDFRAFCHAYPIIMEHLLQEMAAVIRQLSARIFEFSTLGVNRRIQAELLRMAHQSGIRNNKAMIAEAPTQEQIAARVSTHREAVSRELSQLRQHGFLERQGKKALVINDVEALSRLLLNAREPSLGTPRKS
ncbi:Crp/Fnr family transcriptional regulator [Fodinicurvata sediminis]|uniref:Crp/Fnr family transcriptional regulator n=1 Tax=Fodinicurvata sediminis TaxID=1121832 RepID=UPI0003B5DB50|nr:Crp/Fnr family transcriptional regulator [Fodinicurvata sediminis]